MKNVLAVTFLILSISPAAFGMFEAILVQLECGIKNSPIFNADELKVRRFNRTTFVISGSFTLNTSSIADWTAICTVSKKMGNEYKLLPYKVGPSNVCSLLNDEKMLYPDIVAHSQNFPPVGTCDFKTGTYYIKDYLPDLSKVPPVFESGDYMVECEGKRNEEIIQVLRAYAQVYNIKDAAPKIG